MTVINDEILRATAASTINAGLSTWFTRTTSESLNDAEHRWLLAQATTAIASINDMWDQFLRAAPYNYTGSLNDMKLLYWTSQP